MKYYLINEPLSKDRISSARVTVGTDNYYSKKIFKMQALINSTVKSIDTKERKTDKSSRFSIALARILREY